MTPSEYRKIKFLLCASLAAIVFVFSLFFILNSSNAAQPPFPGTEFEHSAPSVTDSPPVVLPTGQAPPAATVPADTSSSVPAYKPPPPSTPVTLADIPVYDGDAYVSLGKGYPSFTQDDLTLDAYESYDPLDELGRCGAAMACIAPELMPTDARDSISSVRPSGWVNASYDFVDGGYLYNRCHLIGFQLTGENANRNNLITGTRYLNIEGMLPFENMVADYIRETGNHVLYRVTPLFAENELVARAVVIEAWSVEDNGDGICFNICAYNVQPGIIINYATGESSIDFVALNQGEQFSFILNTSSKKYHLPTCPGALSMKPENRQEFTGTRELLTAQKYIPCSQCKP